MLSAWLARRSHPITLRRVTVAAHKSRWSTVGRLQLCLNPNAAVAFWLWLHVIQSVRARTRPAPPDESRVPGPLSSAARRHPRLPPRESRAAAVVIYPLHNQAMPRPEQDHWLSQISALGILGIEIVASWQRTSASLSAILAMLGYAWLCLALLDLLSLWAPASSVDLAATTLRFPKPPGVHPQRACGQECTSLSHDRHGTLDSKHCL